MRVDAFSLQTRDRAPAHCTFAVTVAVPFSVNVQVRFLVPPLEHAPDQMASRAFETLSVIEVPVANDDDPELPTATLMPAGLDTTRSPLLPLAVTVSVAA
jgi:hypothetical protein